MFVLGLILILLSAGALVAVLATGTNDQAAMYGGSIELPTLVIFLAGAAALLLFIMGLELVRSGVKRANQNRLNKKRLRKLEKREDARQDGVAGETAPAATGDGTHGHRRPPRRRSGERHRDGLRGGDVDDRRALPDPAACPLTRLLTRRLPRRGGPRPSVRPLGHRGLACHWAVHRPGPGP